MGKKQMFACFLLFTSVTLLNGLFRSKNSSSRTLDIRKFLKTKDVIWTYNTTTAEYTMCKADHMKSISNKTIFFTRSFYCDEKMHRTVKNLEGLFRKQQKDVMQIFNRDRTKRHDLRIWNSFFATGPSEKCFKKYTQLEKHEEIIYNSNYQHILCNKDSTLYQHGKVHKNQLLRSNEIGP
ncbi:uncharacterized protein LOC119458293 isoform X2 [Dermacentor silvarum]|uniref:uncharacterized protein LOC119458293 isoform X2 n=1 Tax=Dermacentor silvarum TaxID=543639 RepID=UPI002100E098|nr:uncharacterized protein LOC119458293 isoform X2 [Dermacentor silvarum]